MSSVLGSDGTGTKISYDAKSAPNRLTFGQGGATIFDAEYASDDQGKVTGATIHSLSGAELSYDYDGLNRPIRRTVEIPNFAALETSMTYLPGANGDTTGLIKSYTNETPSMTKEYYYQYDANGNICVVTPTDPYPTPTNPNPISDPSATTYSYDGLNRLTGEQNESSSLTYAYDDGGNLTSVKRKDLMFYFPPFTLHTYAYENPDWTDQLTAFDNKPITYDALGNPLTYDGYTYTWEKGRQLAGITGNNRDISYAYDASGRRTSKTVDNVLTQYTYSGGLLMRQQGTDTLDFQYDASGTAIGVIYNGTPYFYLRNLQGDVVSIADKNGDLVVNYVYDAWGQVTASNPSMIWGAPIHPVGHANPIRYRGYYYDTETDWYFLQTRYYSPEWKRFINADTLFIAGRDVINGSNMYAYCNGNPVMLVDPSGMASNYFADALISCFLFFDSMFASMFAMNGFGSASLDTFLDMALRIADWAYPLVIKADKTQAERDKFAEAIYVRGQIYERRTGVPAALFAAQACFESYYGTSDFAVYRNNIFGWRNNDGTFTTFESIQACINRYNLRVGRGPGNYVYAHLHGGSLYNWTFGIGPAGYCPESNYGSILWNIMGLYGWR